MNKIRRWFKKYKLDIEFQFGIFLIFVGVIGVFYSVMMHTIGFHNIDLSYNTNLWVNDINYMAKISNANISLDYRDINDQYDINGSYMAYTQGYVMGTDQIKNGFVILFSSAIVLMLGLGTVSNSFEKLKYRNRLATKVKS